MGGGYIASRVILYIRLGTEERFLPNWGSAWRGEDKTIPSKD